MHHHQTPMEPGFLDLWQPELFVIMIGLAVWYLLATSPSKARKSNGTPTIGAKVSFLLGILLIYIALGSPLAYYGHHYSFSLHMIEQSLMFFIVAPLILIGTPPVLLQKLLIHPIAGRILGFFTRPLLSVVLFNMLFSLYHVPLVFDTLHANTPLQYAYHVILQATAFFMWWPVLCPLPKGKNLSHLKKVGYMFANGVLLTPACALIIFADKLLYSSYQTTLPFLDFFSPLEDQQLGGVIMKLIQEIVYATVIGLIFFQWYRAENTPDTDQLLKERKW